MTGVQEMTKNTHKVYSLSMCLTERDKQCREVFTTVQEPNDDWLTTSEVINSTVPSQASSMANIFVLYCEKVIHIVQQTLLKMSTNPHIYTFSMHALSQAHYKYFVKDCLYDTLYLEGILNVVD